MNGEGEGTGKNWQKGSSGSYNEIKATPTPPPPPPPLLILTIEQWQLWQPASTHDFRVSFTVERRKKGARRSSDEKLTSKQNKRAGHANQLMLFTVSQMVNEIGAAKVAFY